jgi:hypothetical protein
MPSRLQYYSRFNHLNLQTKEDYFPFFKKGILKASESSIKNHFPILLENINNFITMHYGGGTVFKNYSEKVYVYFNDITNTPLCRNCGKNHVKFKQFSHGYFGYCSTKCSASSSDKKSAIEATCLEKYGHRNIAHGSERDKIIETFDKKYGSHPSRSEAFKEKYKATSVLRYGTEHFFSSDKGKDVRVASFVKRYGVENPLQVPLILKKMLQTKIDRGQHHKWSKEETLSFSLYRDAVTFHSNKNYRKHYYEINPSRLKRSKNNYHLDHIYPVIEGWVNGIPPEVISHKNNLQMLWYKDNHIKGGRTDMTVEDFYNLIGAPVLD